LLRRSAFFRQLQGFPAFLNFIPRWFSYLFEAEAEYIVYTIWFVQKARKRFQKGASGAAGQACLSKRTYVPFWKYIHRMF